MSTKIDAETVKSYLLGLQDRICAALEHEDGPGRFSEERWQRPEGGVVVAAGSSLKAVYSSREGSISPMSSGRTCLPRLPLIDRSSLDGRSGPWACRWSSTRTNPYVPTAHANVRFISAELAGTEPVGWFGGGFDLTPYYGFEEDVRHWHRIAPALLRWATKNQ